MAEFPFQLLIERNRPDKQTESLTCTALLRTIAGNRRVYDAMWNGQAVIVKQFPHKIKSRYHLKREWRRSCLLHNFCLSSTEKAVSPSWQNRPAVCRETIPNPSQDLAKSISVHAAEGLEIRMKPCSRNR
jgi:hypothetical protein